MRWSNIYLGLNYFLRWGIYKKKNWNDCNFTYIVSILGGTKEENMQVKLKKERLTVSRSCMRGGNKEGYEKLNCS